MGCAGDLKMEDCNFRLRPAGKLVNREWKGEASPGSVLLCGGSSRLLISLLVPLPMLTMQGILGISGEAGVSKVSIPCYSQPPAECPCCCPG
jgi:hypothetical protein